LVQWQQQQQQQRVVLLALLHTAALLRCVLACSALWGEVT
jgi:hypothetical protein